MAKNKEPISEGVTPLDIELDSSVTVEILKDTEHLRKGQIQSVSFAIAKIFINQNIAKIIL